METPVSEIAAGTALRMRHVPAGEGPTVWVAGDTYTFKSTATDTGGRLTVWEAGVPPGAGPPPHLHVEQDEAYYLLEGALEVLNGDTTFIARAGSYVFIPRGTVHAFRNPTDAPSRMLIWMMPAGFEDFLFAIGAPARPGEQAPPLGPDEIARTMALAPQYGLEIHLPDEPSVEKP